MYYSDMESTSFVIDRGMYYYKVMPFGLRNARETYQKLVNQIFKEKIGETMEVYVDDMVINRKKEGPPDLHPGIIWSTSEVQYEVKSEKNAALE
ncbi:hypothetical protein ACFX1T_022908 [Malus domestica]